MKDIYITTPKHCDVHPDRTAEFDEPTVHGPWANLCIECHGTIGAGSAAGYHFVVGEAPERTDAQTRHDIIAAVNAGDFDLAEDLVGDRDIAEFL